MPACASRADNCRDPNWMWYWSRQPQSTQMPRNVFRLALCFSTMWTGSFACQRFQRAGITTCEIRGYGCWYDNGLGFAHAKKRRNLGPGELSVVALACCVCHDRIEILPEQEMAAIVMRVIDSRKSPV